jgi:hypothetical protein
MMRDRAAIFRVLEREGNALRAGGLSARRKSLWGWIVSSLAIATALLLGEVIMSSRWAGHPSESFLARPDRESGTTTTTE